MSQTATTNLIECPICMTQYDSQLRQPKLLKCASNHTICLQCAKGIYKPDTQTIQCPIDNQKFKSQVEDLQTVFVLLQFLDEKNQTRKNTSQETATPDFKGNQCYEHYETQTVYCKTDQVLCCKQCLQRHQGHDLIQIVQLNQDLQYQIDQILKSIQIQITYSDQFIKQAQDVQKHLQNDVQTLTNQIKKDSQILISNITSIMETKIQEINQIHAKKQSEIDQIIFNEQQQIQNYQNTKRPEIGNIKKNFAFIKEFSQIQNKQNSKSLNFVCKTNNQAYQEITKNFQNLFNIEFDLTVQNENKKLIQIEQNNQNVIPIKNVVLFEQQLLESQQKFQNPYIPGANFPVQVSPLKIQNQYDQQEFNQNTLVLRIIRLMNEIPTNFVPDQSFVITQKGLQGSPNFGKENCSVGGRAIVGQKNMNLDFKFNEGDTKVDNLQFKIFNKLGSY